MGVQAGKKYPLCGCLRSPKGSAPEKNTPYRSPKGSYSSLSRPTAWKKYPLWAQDFGEISNFILQIEQFKL